MKISWAVFEIVSVVSKRYRYNNDSVLKLEANGFDSERQAKKYIQHPDNRLQGEFIVLEVIEMSDKTEDFNF